MNLLICLSIKLKDELECVRHVPEVVLNGTRDGLHFPLTLSVVKVNAVSFPPICCYTATVVTMALILHHFGDI